MTVTIEHYLSRVQDALSRDQDAWLVRIEDKAVYALDDGVFRQNGGTELIARAQGALAKLTITDGCVVRVEPHDNLPYRVARILTTALEP